MRHTEPEYAAKQLNRVLIHHGKTMQQSLLLMRTTSKRTQRERPFWHDGTAAILEYRKKNPLRNELFLIKIFFNFQQIRIVADRVSKNDLYNNRRPGISKFHAFFS